MATSGKSTRKSLSIEVKKRLLEEVDKGKKKLDICRDYGIAKSTLSTILKSRKKLECLEDVAPERKRARTAKHSEVDEALLMWFKQKSAMNVPIGGPLMKTKANEFAKELGKFANPRCFKGIRSFPAQYSHNKKAWMTSDIWTKWIRAFNNKMKYKNRNVALVIDNCPAHPHVKDLTNVEVVYLPATTTSKTQPCDQGIIQALKRRYRSYILQKFIHCIDNEEEFKPHVLDAMTLARRAWEEVSHTTIANCFKHCSFVSGSDEDEPSDSMDDCDDSDLYVHLSEHLAKPVSDATLLRQEYVSVDDDIDTCAELESSEIVQMISQHITNEEEENVDMCDGEISKPSEKEVGEAFQVLRNHFLYSDNTEEQLLSLNKLQRAVDQTFLANKQQTRITDYFS